MKQIIVSLAFVVAATAAWAQPARVPVNDPPPANTKPSTPPPVTNTNTTTTTSSTLTKYSDPQGRFTIGYPTEWVFNDKSESAVLQITSPKESDADDFRQNVNLQVEDMSGKNTTVDDYVKSRMNAVKELVKGYTEVSSMFFNRNGFRAYEVVYKGKYGSMTSDIKIKQLFTIANNKAYILTYVCKADERDAYETTANTIFNSFKY